MPAASNTARTPPPAITPVPGEAGFNKNTGSAQSTQNFVRNGDARKINFLHVLVRVVGRFFHGIGNGIGFSNSQTDFAVVVTSHNSNPEGKAAAAFYHFRNTGNFDDAFVIMFVLTVGIPFP